MAASVADIDAALSAQKGEITTLVGIVGQVHTDVTNLLAKAQAGASIDLTAELTQIQNNTAAIQGAVSDATAADAAANPPPTTPPATSS